jgi:hypothetical protein
VYEVIPADNSQQVGHPRADPDEGDAKAKGDAPIHGKCIAIFDHGFSLAEIQFNIAVSIPVTDSGLSLYEAHGALLKLGVGACRCFREFSALLS